MKRLSKVSAAVFLPAVLVLLAGARVMAGEDQPQAAAPVPQTGVTKSCTPGDDGTYQAGVPWPDPRFTVDGDCVTDNLTGLMWAKSFGPAATWTEALAYCKQLDLGGHKDWRMPNVREQLSLSDFSLVKPIASTDLTTTFLPKEYPFINVPVILTRTSTTCAKDTNSYWYVRTDGYVGQQGKDDTQWPGVLPVRGGVDKNGKEITKKGIAPPAKTGQTISYAPGDDGDLQMGVPWPNPRFTDNGNETVTDNLTGLMWSKNANIGGATIGFEALKVCENLELGGYKDWRLPNVKELQTLIDYSSTLAFPKEPFVNTDGVATWSATIWKKTDMYSWAFIANHSGNTVGGRMDSWDFCRCNVWPVRGRTLDPVKPAPANEPEKK